MVSPAWNSQNANTAELFSFLQTFNVQLLALFIMLVPVLHRKSLHKPWIFFFAATSFIFAILAPALYNSVGSAWSNLLTYLSSICQAFLTLQLVKGLQNPVACARKLD